MWKIIGSAENRWKKKILVFLKREGICLCLYCIVSCIFEYKTRQTKPYPRRRGGVSTLFYRGLFCCGTIFAENLRDKSQAKQNIYKLGLKEKTVEIRMCRNLVSRHRSLHISLIYGNKCFFVIIYPLLMVYHPHPHMFMR